MVEYSCNKIEKTMTEQVLPKISSFSAPSDADRETWQALSDDDKRALWKGELQKGLEGTARKVSAADVIRRRKARHGLKHG